MAPGENKISCESNCYFEYWPVNDKGSVGNQEWDSAFRDADFFAFCGRTNSRGSVIIQGVALYVSTKWLNENKMMDFIGQFQTGEGGVAAAGDLPSVCLTPENRKQWDLLQQRASESLNNQIPNNRSIQRRAISVWDCCEKHLKGDSCSSLIPDSPRVEKWKERNPQEWEGAADGLPWWEGDPSIMPPFF
jgi:hypothetical protein